MWKGGVSALMKEVLYANKDKFFNDRNYILYDTFEGMSTPTSEDFKNGRDFDFTQKKFKDLLRRDGSSNWCRGEFKEVESTISNTPGRCIQCIPYQR